MTDTFTAEHRTKLEDYLRTHELPSGIGTEESACSIAAINLAINGKLTDDIPACMSEVLGKATINLQDAMPDKMRNSQRYKRLLPDMAGTGREHEQERLAILLDWMWSVALPAIQPVADERGFGKEWANMCSARTSEAAASAADAAASASHAARAAYTAARAAADARDAAADARDAAARASHAADTAARAAAYAADAGAAAAYAAYTAARAAADARAAAARASHADFWATVDPIGVLERMTYLKGAEG